MITKRREASTWKAASADTAMFGSLQSCIKSKNWNEVEMKIYKQNVFCVLST